MRAKEQLAQFIASGAYSGYCPKAPGTIGTVTAVLAWWIIFGSLLVPSAANQLWMLVIVVIAGTYASHIVLTSPYLNLNGVKDPQFIVIDEWAGVWIALLWVQPDDYSAIFLAFLLFRLFDIVKPGPVGSAERLPGAYGIMADDLVAGLLAALIGLLTREYVFQLFNL